MNVIQGKVVAPRRILLYGVHGIGKSTWAAGAPSCIFTQTEDGLNDLDTHRFGVAGDFESFMTQLKDVYEEKHSYKTLAVDSLDWLERLIHRQVCAEKNVKNIEDIGYAKGYVFAMDFWRRVIEAIDMIRSERGMTVILISHSQVARFEDPEQESYDRYMPQLNKHAAAYLTQWADEILFATYKSYPKSTDEGFGRKRNRAVGTGERVLYTAERPSHVAKNRMGLPDELPMPKEDGWSVFASYMTSQGKKTNGKVKETVHG